MTSVSEDSVFVSGELSVKQSEQLIGELLTMQEKNSLLLKQLSNKSREYDHITEQLELLEREVSCCFALLLNDYYYATWIVS